MSNASPAYLSIFGRMLPATPAVHPHHRQCFLRWYIENNPNDGQIPLVGFVPFDVLRSKSSIYECLLNELDD